MTRREQLKEKIKNGITSGQNIIVVAYHAPQELFDEVLRENPGLAERVRSATLTETPSFIISYNEGKKGGCKSIKNAAGLEEALHAAIGAVEGELFARVPCSLDIERFFSDFMLRYNGYYSNLTRIGYEGEEDDFGGTMQVLFKFEYRIDRKTLQSMEEAVNAKIRELSGKLYAPGMKPETKAYVAHNYLKHSVEYWSKKDATPLETAYMQSAYGALINGRCVCQGYAEAYKRLLNAQGIISEVVVGRIKGRTERHAWNIICCNGVDYCHVDVTWDDGADTLKYYGVSDEEMKKTRLWSCDSKLRCRQGYNALKEAKVQIALNKAEYFRLGIDRVYLGL